MSSPILTILYVEDDALVAADTIDEIEDTFGEAVKVIGEAAYDKAAPRLDSSRIDYIFSDGGYPGKIPGTDEGGADLYGDAVALGMADRFYFVTGRSAEDMQSVLRGKNLPPIDDEHIFQKPKSVSKLLQIIMGTKAAGRPAFARDSTAKPFDHS